MRQSHGDHRGANGRTFSLTWTEEVSASVSGASHQFTPGSGGGNVSSSVLPGRFPTTLPYMDLAPADQKFKYGLGKQVTPLVRDQLKTFVKWSTDDIQLTRDGAYSAAVQLSTTDKHETCIMAYLGYLTNVRTDVADCQIALQAYASPIWIAGFISYLRARDVGRGHILKHLSLAKKVNNWLVSGECMGHIIMVCWYHSSPSSSSHSSLTTTVLPSRPRDIGGAGSARRSDECLADQAPGAAGGGTAQGGQVTHTAAGQVVPMGGRAGHGSGAVLQR